jgi:hypothetical protein
MGSDQALALQRKTDVHLLKLSSIFLAIASLPYLLASSYEMFVLTPRHGPQMIFFSAVHSWPGWLVAVLFTSWLLYYALLAVSAVITLFTSLGKFKTYPRFVRSMQAAFCILAVHLALVLLYGCWSDALFGR